MKINSLLFIVLIMVFFSCYKNIDTSSNSQREIIQDTIATVIPHYPDFNKTFMGVIDVAENVIIMSLNNEQGELSGYYYHNGSGDYIKTKGEINLDGNLKLRAFDQKNNEIGTFKGEINNSEIYGTWENLDGSVVVQFYLSEDEFKHGLNQKNSASGQSGTINDETIDQPIIDVTPVGLWVWDDPSLSGYIIVNDNKTWSGQWKNNYDKIESAGGYWEGINTQFYLYYEYGGTGKDCAVIDPSGLELKYSAHCTGSYFVMERGH